MYNENLLNYWYAIEFSTPCYPFEKKKSTRNIPWPKTDAQEAIRTFFDVYIGQADTQKLIHWMIQELKLKEEDKFEVNTSKCCLFALKVDANGLYVDQSFSIAGFVWSVCQLVKNGYNTELDNTSFNTFKEKIISNFLHENDEPVVVDETILNTIYLEILKQLNLPCDKISFTFFANRIENKGFKRKATDKEYFFYPVNPKTEMMDSFYLSDIKKIKKNPTEKIEKFISGKRENEIQIDTNIAKMKEWTSPDKYPLGLWPSSYSPCLMQQIAINLSISNEQAIFSVNGPPGTGKTTLLKEIIVSNIVDRAIAMLNFAHPDDAFEEKKFKNPPDQYNPNFYKLDKRLSQNGIVVASNNNFAVENLSLELPKAIKDGGLTGYFGKSSSADTDYFSDIASHLIDEPAWGLISACLGNKRNINTFLSKFWFKDKSKESSETQSMQDYFGEAKNKQNGKTCDIDIPDWEIAKRNFRTALVEVKEIREKINVAVAYVTKYEEKKEEIEKASVIYHKLDGELTEEAKTLSELEFQREELSTDISNKEKQVENIKQRLPFYKRWFKYLFKSDTMIIKWRELEEEINNIFLESLTIDNGISEEEKKIKRLTEKKQSQEAKIKELQSDVSKLESEKEIYKNCFDKSLADSKFWENIDKNEDSQRIAPYIYKDYDKAREELFYQAMILHKAFILNSQKTYQNICRLFNLWNDKYSPENRREAYADLFNTFQLIVPVVSTTFASVQSFFNGIEANELGLFIIDEAGQATPQSALGAIWRSKKVVIVGDPLQVEPIITVPRELQTIYADKFHIAPENRLPELSVQVLADRINKYIGTRVVGGQDMKLGCPLIVHRRCINPMFTISNQIAYNNKMMNFTPEPTNISFTFSQSFWLNIQGSMKAKGDQNIEEQNTAAIQIFQEAMQTSKALPNMYIISPFKKVAFTLRNLLKNCIEKQNPKLDSKKRTEWVEEHCGTIHTFQGKEANEVLLVLGCDFEKGKGAAKWVGQKPNIINVAVSRAKYRIYVIGDYEHWKDIANVNVLCENLPCIDSISKLDEIKAL